MLAVDELGDVGHVLEERVISQLDVLEFLSQGDMKNRAQPHGVIEPDLHQEGRLAHSGTRHDHTEFAGCESPLAAALEDADWAACVDLIQVHRTGVIDCRPSCLLAGFGLVLAPGGDELLLNRLRHRYVSGKLHREVGFPLRGRS